MQEDRKHACLLLLSLPASLWWNPASASRGNLLAEARGDKLDSMGRYWAPGNQIFTTFCGGEEGWRERQRWCSLLPVILLLLALHELMVLHTWCWRTCLPLFQSFLHPLLLFQVITYKRWEITVFARGFCPNAIQSRQQIFLISCQTPHRNSYNVSFSEWIYFVFISDETNLHDLCSETYTMYWILIRRVLSRHCSAFKANTHAQKNYCCRHGTCGLGVYFLAKLL